MCSGPPPAAAEVNQAIPEATLRPPEAGERSSNELRRQDLMSRSSRDSLCVEMNMSEEELAGLMEDQAGEACFLGRGRPAVRLRGPLPALVLKEA